MTRAPTVNVFAGGTLDRAMHLRRDDDALEAAWRSPASRVVVSWRGHWLLQPAELEVALLPAAWAIGLLTARPDLPWALLGLVAGAHPVFALDLGDDDEPEQQLPAGAGVFVELRAAAATLPAHESALLAYGAALLAWRERARFCGHCGARCAAEQAGHVMVCTGCARHCFPRTDPTVIMLVTHGERALLGHSARFPGRMYSALAGFVEPGESLEEAVVREVMEEAAVAVGRVTYHSSQPWPFPMNLMLGFHAEALSEAITVDPSELLDARWFSRGDLRDPAAVGISLPPGLSIAGRLIADWLEW